MGDSTIPDSTVADIHLRFDAGNVRMKALEDGLAENTAATKRIEAGTADMIEFFSAMQGAFKVFNWIGKAAKPIGYIAAAGASVVAFVFALKGGK